MTMLTVHCETLTPIWTGGVGQQSDHLHETGLIGSLRWWYEALVRGLGGYACDPTGEGRCPDDDGHHCVACELFGCTGWGRKFRLRVADDHGQTTERALSEGMRFALQFIPLRNIEPAEEWLLTRAIRIAADYGSIGGKTTGKPQQNSRVWKDRGLIALSAPPPPSEISRSHAKVYLTEGNWRRAEVKLPDLRWFFFIKGAFLWRREINALLGLSEDGRAPIGHEPHQGFLRGSRGSQTRPAVSKKVFSFAADGGRVWGYAPNAAMRDIIVQRVQALMSDVRRDRPLIIKTGEEVLHEL
jgi:CRISPR-associated protein Cmr1